MKEALYEWIRSTEEIRKVKDADEEICRFLKWNQYI